MIPDQPRKRKTRGYTVVSISLSPLMLDEIDEHVEQTGETRSGFLTRAFRIARESDRKQYPFIPAAEKTESALIERSA
jgi:predicted nucleic acid-binding protein